MSGTVADETPSDAAADWEYPIKASFLHNFGSYIEWPAEAFPTREAPFVIGVLSSEPLHRSLLEMAMTKNIAGRDVAVLQFASKDAVRTCHILFVTREVEPSVHAEVIERFRGEHVLIVGESPGFASRGGGVNLVVEANKIRFEVNLEVAKQQRLRVSSKLLALARIVDPSN